jgi:hypothetical protein
MRLGCDTHGPEVVVGAVTPPHQAAFALRPSTPDAFHLLDPHGPAEALIHDRATTADGLGLGDLNMRQDAVTYGEEQFGVDAHTGALFAPVRCVVALFCCGHGLSRLREGFKGLSCETGRLADV